MRLSSLYKVTSAARPVFTPGDLDHNSWESVELDASHRGGLCLGAWGAGLEQGGFPES